MEKIFRLRTELESLAVEWAKENVTPEDIEYLRGVTVKMKAAAQTLDLDQFYQNDLAFHRKLWEFPATSIWSNAWSESWRRCSPSF